MRSELQIGTQIIMDALTRPDELEELREWIRDEGCAEAMSAVGLFENLRK